MSVEHMLTTMDNPYSPVTQYDEWYAWDEQAGYHTPGLLARIAVTSDELSDVDNALATERAIDTICLEIGPGLYKRVVVPNSSS